MPTPEAYRGPSEPSPQHALDAGHARRGCSHVLLAACLAALTAWGAGEWHRTRFAPKYHMSAEKRAQAKTSTAEVRRQMHAATRDNAAFSFGTLGGLLGLGLGALGGRTARTGVRGALVGLALGASAGAALSWRLVPAYYAHAADPRVADDITFPFLLHLAVWCAVGAAAGCAYGTGLGSWRSAALAALGGAIGAAAGTVAYEVLGALAFPLAETTMPVAREALPRLTAHLAVALPAAAGAWYAAHSLQLARRPAPPPAAAAG